jgi:hypothetical protein
MEWGGTVPNIPWSHGLLMSLVWSAATVGTVFAFTRSWRSGMILGGVVFSHWVLDYISHPMGFGEPLPPDLPLLFGSSPKVGLGLYNSLPAAIVTEIVLLAGGITVYLLSTRTYRREGSVAPAARWSLVVLLGAIFVLPAAMSAVPARLSAVSCFFLLGLVPAGYWADRHRGAVGLRRRRNLSAAKIQK